MAAFDNLSGTHVGKSVKYIAISSTNVIRHVKIDVIDGEDANGNSQLVDRPSYKPLYGVYGLLRHFQFDVPCHNQRLHERGMTALYAD